MTETSKPCWRAAFDLIGMPDWATVAVPAAASFFHESGCQGESCENQAPVFMAFYLCRLYCPSCAQKNLMVMDEARKQFLLTPFYMIEHLPWTYYNVDPPTSTTEKERYYLKSDLERLQRRVTSTGLKSMTELRRETAVFESRGER
ncbi:hypothetical protein FRB90_012401, partial [Tulasnella sp. 427]